MFIHAKAGLCAALAVSLLGFSGLSLEADAKDKPKLDKFHQVGNTRVVYLKTGLSKGQVDDILSGRACCVEGPHKDRDLVKSKDGDGKIMRKRDDGRVYHRMRNSDLIKI